MYSWSCPTALVLLWPGPTFGVPGLIPGVGSLVWAGAPQGRHCKPERQIRAGPGKGTVRLFCGALASGTLGTAEGEERGCCLGKKVNEKRKKDFQKLQPGDPGK